MLSESNSKVNTLTAIDTNCDNEPIYINNKILEFATARDRERFNSYRRGYSELYSLVDWNGVGQVIQNNIDPKTGHSTFTFIKIFNFVEFRQSDYYEVIEAVGRNTIVKQINFAKQWIKEPELHNKYNRVAFNLTPNYSCKDTFNLFRGFITPESGNPEPFLKLLNGMVPDSNDSGYIIKLLAWVLKNPHLNPGIVLLLLGEEGVGKTTIYNTLAQIMPGNHSKTSSIEKILGFNYWSAFSKVISLEEAFDRGNPFIKQQMKDLVSGDKRDVTLKGFDTTQIENVVFYIATSNLDKPISIDPSDRRYAVFSCQRNLDFDFEAYHDWLRNKGGAAIVFNYLLSIDLTTFNRKIIPNNEAKNSLKLASAHSHEEFLSDLIEGEYDNESFICQWADNANMKISRNALYKFYCEVRRSRTAISPVDFSRLLCRVFKFPIGWKDNWKNSSGRFFIFPDRQNAKKMFDNYIQGRH